MKTLVPATFLVVAMTPNAFPQENVGPKNVKLLKQRFEVIQDVPGQCHAFCPKWD